MFWNAVIGFKCLREARIVAIGPTIAAAGLDAILNQYAELEESAKQQVVFSVIAHSVTLRHRMHPNICFLLEYAMARFDLQGKAVDLHKLRSYITLASSSTPSKLNSQSLSSRGMLFPRLPSVPLMLKRKSQGGIRRVDENLDDVKVMVLKVFALVSVLQGWLQRAEMRLFAELAKRAGVPVRKHHLQKLLYLLLDGEISGTSACECIDQWGTDDTAPCGRKMMEGLAGLCAC
jgi:hypothetical protein